MRKLFAWIFLFSFAATAYAQSDLATDYLSTAFHIERRAALRNLMPANSVVVIFSYPERVFSKDVNYVFHQNPDLYYFSGYNEPDAVLLVFKEMQGAADSAYNELFFVRMKDSSQETWTGRRLGVEGTKAQLGFKNVYEGKRFKDFPIDFKKFKAIIYDKIPNDVPDDDSGFDLYGLLNTFRAKANIRDDNDKLHDIKQSIVAYATTKSLPRLIAYLNKTYANDEDFKKDPYLQQLLLQPDSVTLEGIKEKLKQQRNGRDVFADLTNSLRQIKTPEEMKLIRKSVKISAIGHSEVMKAVTPAMSEREAEGIHEYIHNKYGAEEEGYPPIVGAGANGCILHYEENSSTKVNNQLLLMDVACEYHGYSADVTRTVPANGKFSPEQKAIYQLVYDAQEAVFELCKEGETFNDLEKKASDVLANGLISLGILKEKKDLKNYYPHGVSHYIGLDVHDKGNYKNLMENMVITVEPGIYIPAQSNCDKKWWNIGVRIEDDVRIGKEKFELLSVDAPRKWEDVEKKTSEKSKFNEIALQPL